jgi:senataxin
VLAAARAKASAPNDGENRKGPLPSYSDPKFEKAATVSEAANPTASVAADTESPKLKRKIQNSEATKSSCLANLLSNVASKEAANGSDSLSSAAFASNISPDDFWKNLRDWDLVSDLAHQREEQERNRGTKPEDQIGSTVKKPIPDTFISFRHYIAAWAPLCLAETRAQLLSDVLTECGQNLRRNPLHLVDVETTWKGGKSNRGFHADLMDIDSCHVILRTNQRGTDNKFQFFAHDICCLIPTQYRDIVERLLRGGQLQNKDDSYRKFGMIGHTEGQRKDLNGLVLKVSKRRWAQIGSPQMFLLRIGGNITALREFTALCRVETIPLKRYLLGHHLDKGDKRASVRQATSSHPTQKEVLLKKMGGVEALGKGFTEYAQKKFNPSQLMAISASAQGYGDGGFTLIKGPPGTGSKCEREPTQYDFISFFSGSNTIACLPTTV